MNLLFFKTKYGRLILEFIAWIIFGILDFFHKQKKIPAIKDNWLLQPAVDLARKIRNKEITSEELLKTYIKRIKETNPLINALVQQRFEKALEEAKEADDYIRCNPDKVENLESTKPFFGVPFTQKDVYAVSGLPLTSGIYHRKNAIAKEDATCTRLMKESGAICLGLTNVSEACFWWESYNTIYGKTSNPYNIHRTAGGSSGGQGALLAAGGSVFGVGSDFGGSIRIPALFNGIFGHKPSPGVVDFKGRFPPPPVLSATNCSVAGVMCRYASDMLPMLKVLAAENRKLLNLDESVDLKNLKVYYMLDMGCEATADVDPEILKGLLKAVDYLQTIVKAPCEEVKFPELKHIVDMFSAATWEDDIFIHKSITSEKDINVWLEWIKLFMGMSTHTLPGLYACTVEKYRDSMISKENQNIAKKRLSDLRYKFKEFMKPNTVLLLPTNPLQAPHHYEALLKPLNFTYTGLANILYLPSTACPLGLSSKGLPIGIQVIGRHLEDRICIEVAEKLEKAFGGWVPPSM